MRLALAACLTALVLTGTAGAASSLTYVALGDSVAAGYGLGANQAPCARAETRSYPSRVARQLERRHGRVELVHLACSGAVAVTTERGPGALATQVGSALAAIGRRTSLVSITIGINDLEWWNLPRVARLLRGDRATYEAWVAGAVGDVRVALRGQLRRLSPGRGSRSPSPATSIPSTAAARSICSAPTPTAAGTASGRP